MPYSSMVAVIAEDDPDTQELITLVLEQSGFTVISVDDGRAALAAVREHEPLLTTLDIGMPGPDGFATAKRIREFSNTYLIMITSLDDEIDLIRGFEAGADDYLVKPFRPRELRARADAMVRRVRLLDAAAATRAARPAMAPESRAAARTDDGALDPGEPRPVRPAAAASDPQPRHDAAPWASSTPRVSHTVTDDAVVTSSIATQNDRYIVRRAESVATSLETQSEKLPALSLHPGHGAFPTDPDGTLTAGELRVEPLSGRATLTGRDLGLSKPESDILVSLLHGGMRVRSRADLVLAVRGDSHVTSTFVNEADKRAVDLHVANLRTKLGDDQDPARWISAVKGVGYRLVAQL